MESNRAMMESLFGKATTGAISESRWFTPQLKAIVSLAGVRAVTVLVESICVQSGFPGQMYWVDVVGTAQRYWDDLASVHTTGLITIGLRYVGFVPIYVLVSQSNTVSRAPFAYNSIQEYMVMAGQVFTVVDLQAADEDEASEDDVPREDDVPAEEVPVDDAPDDDMPDDIPDDVPEDVWLEEDVLTKEDKLNEEQAKEEQCAPLLQEQERVGQLQDDDDANKESQLMESKSPSLLPLVSSTTTLHA